MCYIYDPKVSLRCKGLLLVFLSLAGTASQVPLVSVVKYLNLKNGCVDMRPLSILIKRGYIKLRRLSTGDVVVYDIVDSVPYI